MGHKNPAVFCQACLRLALILAVLAGGLLALPTLAADLPLAASSPLVGITFDDRPLLLPVQRNFQMAMLTASSELGRSCGRMEAYGWRMSQQEQGRVNGIFNGTVERLRSLGYTIASEAPASVSHDITLFSADKADKHFLFMWSAGEIGLVMTLCESTAPAGAKFAAMASAAPPARLPPQDVVQSTLQAPLPRDTHKTFNGKFSPVGAWIGSYVCEQGYTGGTFAITRLHGQNFEGVFRFYPTPRNQMVPRGSYNVAGQYDATTQRIVINPGKWIQRPRNYYNTVMVGVFDPGARTFSAFFQGISGCTSFEAKYGGDIYGSGESRKAAHKKKRVKKAVPKPAVTAAPMDSGGPNDSANVPAISLPAAAPDSPAVPAAVAPPAQTPPPQQTPPKKSSLDAPGHTSQLLPQHLGHPIVLAASGQFFTPVTPQAPPARMYNATPPMASTVPMAAPASQNVPQAPMAPPTPTAPVASALNPVPTGAPAAEIAPTAPIDTPYAPVAPMAASYDQQAPMAPPAQMVPQTGDGVY